MSWAVLRSIAMNIAKKICWIWMVSIQYGPHANQGIKEIACSLLQVCWNVLFPGFMIGNCSLSNARFPPHTQVAILDLLLPLPVMLARVLRQRLWRGQFPRGPLDSMIKEHILFPQNFCRGNEKFHIYFFSCSLGSWGWGKWKRSLCFGTGFLGRGWTLLSQRFETSKRNFLSFSISTC